MNLFYLSIILLFLAFPFRASAQVDTLDIRPIEVIATPLKNLDKHSFDASDIQNSPSSQLADFLQAQVGIFVKSYGKGSSATSSIRGGSAEHTQVLWNNLSLQNAMLGQSDLSLIPLFFIDKLEVHKGANTATWGDGAIGGTLHLKNAALSPSTKNAFNTLIGFGQFGQYQQGIDFIHHHAKFSFRNRLYYETAENDFTFLLGNPPVSKRQKHAHFSQWAGLHEAYLNINSRQQLTFQYWWQSYDREIPPATTQSINLAKQYDKSHRISSTWSQQIKKGKVELQGAYFHERLNYQDPLNLIDNKSKINSFFLIARGTKRLSEKFSVNLALSEYLYQVRADQYQEEELLSRRGAKIGMVYLTEHWKLGFDLRQNFQQTKRLPLVPSWALSYHPIEQWTIFSKVTRNFRNPNLNALFYYPTGNPDLLAEEGWSQEVGFHFKNKKPQNKIVYSFKGVFYHRNIKNWIRWAPNSQGFYEPQNIAQVISKGFESDFSLHKNFKNLTFKIALNYQYISSTHQEAIESFSIIKGDQLAYTPTHQAYGSLSISHSFLKLSYQQQYTGKVKTLNFSELEDYGLGSVQLNLNLKRKNTHHFISLSIQNIWNKNYQIVERRAMPRRYFQIKINNQLNYNNEN